VKLVTSNQDRDWYSKWNGLYGEIRLAQRCPVCKGRNYPEAANEICSVWNGFGWVLTDAGVMYRQMCLGYKKGTPCPYEHKQLNEFLCPYLVRLVAEVD